MGNGHKDDVGIGSGGNILPGRDCPIHGEIRHLDGIGDGLRAVSAVSPHDHPLDTCEQVVRFEASRDLLMPPNPTLIRRAR